MGVCEQCTHYRRLKPASQLLAAAFSTTTDAAVQGALTKVVEDEQKQRESEAEYKRAQATADRDRWATKPVMADFCGFQEAEGVFLIAEIKNQGGRCSDFVAGKPERHACAECRHRVPAAGPETDIKMEEEYASMSVESISAGMQANQSDSLLTKYREGEAARKGFEITGAYAAKGVMAALPAYLDHCALYSTEDEFVLTILRNPHHTCPGWEAGPPQVAAPSAAAGEPATAAPATTPAAAAVPGEPAPPVAAAAAAYVPVPPAAIVAPPAAEPPPPTPSGPEVVLVEGSPPLTSRTIDRMVAFFQWVLDVPVGLAHRSLMQQSVIEDWQKGDSATISGAQQMDSMMAEVEKADEARRIFLRESIQASIVQGLRTDGSEASKALLELYDAANQPIALGDPPLTQEMCQSFLDMLAFIVGAAHGVQPQPLTPALREAWTQQLMIAYPTTSPEQRAWISSTPLGWATLRVAWPSYSEQDRANLIAQWRTELGPAFEAMDQARQAAAAQATYAAQSPAAPPAGPAAAASAPATDGDRSTDQMIEDLAETQRKEEEELMKTNPELAIQKRLQHQQAYSQMMSNMLQMQHQTSMAIINNMRA